MKPLGWEWKHFEVSAPKISYHRFNPPCNDDLDKWASWQTLYRPSKYWIDSFLRAFFSDLQKLWISGKSGLQICKVKLEFAQKIVLKMCNDAKILFWGNQQLSELLVVFPYLEQMSHWHTDCSAFGMFFFHQGIWTPDLSQPKQESFP